MSVKKGLRPKIYLVVIDGKELLVRAKTRQGAIAAATERLVKTTCEYADQNTLYTKTKAGVERLDAEADESQPLLPGVEVPQ